MATLKIYQDIQTDDEKSVMRMFGAVEGVSYTDIDAFMASVPEDDKAIDIRLHCNGGSVMEGWAIYDRLRASGKEITATVEGTCASMATVILMAAPKERRNAYENAHLCVHNPYICPCVIGETATADDLRKAADDLAAEQRRMVDLYVERCGCDREQVERLMSEDRLIDVNEALTYGFIGHIIPPISAKKIEKMEVKKSLIDRMLAKLGLKNIDEVEALDEPRMVALELNTETGGTLTVDRESGDPQVGDAARPDGVHTLPDGKVVTVENGIITDIAEVEAPDTDDDVDEQKGEVTEPAEPDTEGEEVQQLRRRVEELEQENRELRRQLDESQAEAKTDEDKRILALAKLCGGEEGLKTFSSTWTPEGRQPKGARASAVVSVTDILEKQKKVYNK